MPPVRYQCRCALQDEQPVPPHGQPSYGQPPPYDHDPPQEPPPIPSTPPPTMEEDLLLLGLAWLLFDSKSDPVLLGAIGWLFLSGIDSDSFGWLKQLIH